MVDVNTLRRWNAALSVLELDPRDEIERNYYVELVQPGRGQVDEIGASIDISLKTDSVHLISGPRGSGKSTELLRLRDSLENRGHPVVYFDILDYVNEEEALDVEIFLVVMGLAVSDALDPEGGAASFATQLRDWIGQWRPQDLEAEAALDTGPISITISGWLAKIDELGPEMRGNPAFVKWLRNSVTSYVRNLKERVDRLISDLASAHGGGQSLVIIVDSLERVGSSRQENAEKTARLFLDHPRRLTFPRSHVVYTVPPVAPIKFTGFETAFGGVLHQITVPRVGQIDHGGVEAQLFVDAIERRVGDISKVLDQTEVVDRVVRASGGHLGDLFALMSRILVVARARGAELPVSRDIAEEAIADFLPTFRPGTQEAEQVLRWVVGNDDHSAPSEQAVPILAHLLATHVVLHRRNSQDWYEAHPLSLEATGIS